MSDEILRVGVERERSVRDFQRFERECEVVCGEEVFFLFERMNSECGMMSE